MQMAAPTWGAGRGRSSRDRRKRPGQNVGPRQGPRRALEELRGPGFQSARQGRAWPSTHCPWAPPHQCDFSFLTPHTTGSRPGRLLGVEVARVPWTRVWDPSRCAFLQLFLLSPECGRWEGGFHAHGGVLRSHPAEASWLSRSGSGDAESVTLLRGSLTGARGWPRQGCWRQRTWNAGLSSSCSPSASLPKGPPGTAPAAGVLEEGCLSRGPRSLTPTAHQPAQPLLSSKTRPGICTLQAEHLYNCSASLFFQHRAGIKSRT